MYDRYLEKAWQAYTEIPADKINDRVRCLCRLADVWEKRGGTAQADDLRNEAIKQSNNPQALP